MAPHIWWTHSLALHLSDKDGWYLYTIRVVRSKTLSKLLSCKHSSFYSCHVIREFKKTTVLCCLGNIWRLHTFHSLHFYHNYLISHSYNNLDLGLFWLKQYERQWVLLRCCCRSKLYYDWWLWYVKMLFRLNHHNLFLLSRWGEVYVMVLLM